jgi:hypothetical protein
MMPAALAVPATAATVKAYAMQPTYEGVWQLQQLRGLCRGTSWLTMAAAATG